MMYAAQYWAGCLHEMYVAFGDDVDVKGPKAVCDRAMRATHTPPSCMGFQISSLAEHERRALVFFKTVYMSDNDRMVACVVLCV